MEKAMENWRKKISPSTDPTVDKSQSDPMKTSLPKELEAAQRVIHILEQEPMTVCDHGAG
jgi:hypothetical protein